MFSSAQQCSSVLISAHQCSSVFSSALQSSAVLSSAQQCSAVLSSAQQCSEVLSSVQQCSAVCSSAQQCPAVLISAQQCSAVLKYPHFAVSEWSTDLYSDAANLLASDAGDVVSAGLNVIQLFSASLTILTKLVCFVLGKSLQQRPIFGHKA